MRIDAQVYAAHGEIEKFGAANGKKPVREMGGWRFLALRIGYICHSL